MYLLQTCFLIVPVTRLQAVPRGVGFETSKDKLGEQQFAVACFPAVLMSRLNPSGISAAGTDAPLSSYNVRLVTSGLDPKERP